MVRTATPSHYPAYELHLGDCLQVLVDLPDSYVDLALADLPYGATKCRWDTPLNLRALWKELSRIVKPDGAIVLTASQPFTTALIASNYSMFKYCWVWEKTKVTGVLNAKRQPLRCVEDVVVFYKEQCTYNPQGVSSCSRETSTGNTGCGNSDNYGDVDVGTYLQTQTGYPRQIVRFPSVGKTIHPTQKPIALMGYFIKTYTNKGDVVMDFAMGSGTTVDACIELDRSFIGIEKDGEYYEIAKKRIEDTIKDKAQQLF